MSEKYKFRNAEGKFFVTCTVVHWIDLFTRKEFKHIIIDSLKYCQNEKGLVIHAWCIMPSHIHMIVSTEDSSLSNLMRDFKTHTSKRIIETLGLINESRKEWLIRAFQKAATGLKRISKHKVWKDGNHPIELMSNKFLDEKIQYIHNNPVESEIVDEPEYYWYSSARDYADKQGLINVKLID